MKQYELTGEQWNKVKDLFPPEKPAHGGKPGKDNQVMLNGIRFTSMAAAQKGGEEALVRSRKELRPKVHVVDRLGNPLWLLLSLGNRNDICYAQKLLEPFDLLGKFMIVDKGYDSDKFVRWLEERGLLM